MAKYQNYIIKFRSLDPSSLGSCLSELCKTDHQGRQHAVEKTAHLTGDEKERLGVCVGGRGGDEEENREGVGTDGDPDRDKIWLPE